MSRLLLILWRSLRLKCPCCGRGSAVNGWFSRTLHCPACGVAFERESGFFLGSIYFNCGVAALIAAITMPALYISQIIDTRWVFPIGASLAIGFPVLFFPWSRSLWLGLDEYLDPRS